MMNPSPFFCVKQDRFYRRCFWETFHVVGSTISLWSVPSALHCATALFSRILMVFTQMRSILQGLKTSEFLSSIRVEIECDERSKRRSQSAESIRVCLVRTTLPSVDLLSELVRSSFTVTFLNSCCRKNNFTKICIVNEFSRCRVFHLRFNITIDWNPLSAWGKQRSNRFVSPGEHFSAMIQSRSLSQWKIPSP